MRRRWGLAAAGLVGALGLMVLPVSPVGATRHPQSVGPLPYYSKAQLVSEPDSMGAVLAKRFKSVFGDIEVTDGGQHVVVLLTRLEPTVTKAISEMAPRGMVSFAKTHLSASKLAKLQKRVTNSQKALARKGIDLASWFPGIRGDGLEHIGVIGLTKKKATVLHRMFGAHDLVLSNVRRRDLPVATTSGTNSSAPLASAPRRREGDSAPWHGGDNIDQPVGNNVWNYCTAGVGIAWQGAEYMLTAGHCFPSGSPIYNGIVGGPYMGEVSPVQKYRWPGGDTELLDMSVTNPVWTGAIDHPSLQTVVGFGTNPLGSTVYNEGALSGQVGATVISDFPPGDPSAGGGCIKEQDGKTGPVFVACHVIEAVAPPGEVANETGDSGGPVVQFVNGGVVVTGIVSSGNTKVNCAPGMNPGTCFNQLYYTAMTWIMWNGYPGACIVDTTSCGANPPSGGGSPPPPTSNPSIGISWGSNPAPSGDWMNITFTNFPTGQVSWYCVEEGVSYGPYSTTLSSSTETLTSNTCYDTESGGSDYVTSNGATSNTIATDSGSGSGSGSGSAYSEATGFGRVDTFASPNGPADPQGPTLAANTVYPVVCRVSATAEGPSHDPWWYEMTSGYYGSADAFCDEGATTCPGGFAGTPAVDDSVPLC